MKLTSIIALLAIAFLSGCTATNDAFDIRSADRPVYKQTIAPAEIGTFLEQGGVLVDARLSEDFDQDPVLIPGAIRVDPENTSYWKTADKETPVAVYCVKGKWVSQKQAAYIADLGFKAYSVDGGVLGYQEFSRANE